MGSLRIVDVSDTGSFGRIPPCADPSFDHRTCDYWEDADRGSKAARASWLAPVASGRPSAPRPPSSLNPFAPDDEARPENPFLAAAQGRRGSIAADELFGSDTDGEPDLLAPPAVNPFAPTSQRERPMREGVPRKLGLLDRGRGIFGSYAKVLLLGDTAVAYAQFGPLSAYPRATRLRDLYPQLPQAPLPAVITCIATTPEARRQGHARTLIAHVCEDLSQRGFAAVESYPDLTRPEDHTSAGRPILWHECGFVTAVDDPRFPVMRRELT
ncbi:MAG: GNAT family N-acetyltransferase [Actinomycetota bacterium]|nr:GNAT family N-acetyltransferase [Actinomycetota bacterium]